MPDRKIIRSEQPVHCNAPEQYEDHIIKSSDEQKSRECVQAVLETCWHSEFSFWIEEKQSID